MVGWVAGEMENKAIFQLEVEVEVEVGAWEYSDIPPPGLILCKCIFLYKFKPTKNIDYIEILPDLNVQKLPKPTAHIQH